MAGSKEELKYLRVDDSGDGMRLDVFLAQHLEGLSRAKGQKLIAAGSVIRNGQVARARDLLKAGDELEIRQAPPRPEVLEPIKLDLDILYEDEHVLVVNKAAGISVHPGAGETGPTLVHGLLYHAGRLGGGAGEEPAAQRPGIVHRLDKDTTGALVCAKTDAAHHALAKQFHDKTNFREYAALLDGRMTAAEVEHQSYLYRDPRSRVRFASMPAFEGGVHPKAARYAKSLFIRQTVYLERLTLARVVLFTGRTHQIRVHAQDLKLPVLGDLVYGRKTELPKAFPLEIIKFIQTLDRQMLHARMLGFTHPATGEKMLFEAPYPADFEKLLTMLAPLSQS